MVPPDVVLVGVAAKDVLQPGDAFILQVGDDQTAVLDVAAVVEHTLPVAGHQDAQGLSHVDEVDRKSAALGGLNGLRGAGGGLLRLLQGSQQVLTAGQAENQRGGQRQRSDPAQQRGQGCMVAVFLHLLLFPFFLFGLVRGAKRAPGWTV